MLAEPQDILFSQFFVANITYNPKYGDEKKVGPFFNLPQYSLSLSISYSSSTSLFANPTKKSLITFFIDML